MRACDIASDGLVYALEPEDCKGQLAIKALANILKAQQFDAIPLILHHGGMVTKVARRRLHDGDEYDTFILGINEVEVIPRDKSIIESIFLLLSNEHHILFLKDDNEVITDILTLSMLAVPEIRSYLTLKISELVRKGWHWNCQYLELSNNEGFSENQSLPSVKYANLIYSKLVELSNLVSDDAEMPTDYEVSKLIVEILSLIQPLKPFSDAEDLINDDDFHIQKDMKNYHENTAKTIQSWPMASILPDQDKNVETLVFEIFSKANDWDRILVSPESNKSEFMVIERKEDDLIKSEACTIDEITTHDEVAALLVEDNDRLIVVNNKDEKWPGVITIHDFALNERIEAELIKRLAKIETRCRVKLLQLGIYASVTRGSNNKQVWTQNISFDEMIKLLRKELLLDNEKVAKLNIIREYRNRLVHDIVGYPLKKLPILHYSNFLDTYQISIELENIFDIDHKEYEKCIFILITMGGLRAFCLQEGHSRKKNGNYGRRRVFKTKLIDELEEMSINGRTLSVKLRDGAGEVNSVLDSKIGNTSNVWRDELLQYLEEIDKLIID